MPNPQQAISQERHAEQAKGEGLVGQCSRQYYDALWRDEVNYPFFIVDAFTKVLFGGNPAAVCLLHEQVSTKWMQGIAAETCLSETAFVQLGENSKFKLRWFTPIVEVDICGHATLASALVLWKEGLVPGDQIIEFGTRSGLLTATQVDEGISLDFPLIVPSSFEPPSILRKALGVEMLWVGSAGSDILVEVESPSLVRGLEVNLSELRIVETRGVIVTAKGDIGGTADFVSRFFAPRFGIDEDPVTGSAHCALGPYWAAKLGKSHLKGHQLSARGGEVGVIVGTDSVSLIGEAVMVMKGALQ
jgi:PhzF family phenazine biosynthesis protein